MMFSQIVELVVIVLIFELPVSLIFKLIVFLIFDFPDSEIFGVKIIVLIFELTISLIFKMMLSLIFELIVIVIAKIFTVKLPRKTFLGILLSGYLISQK